MMQMIGVGTALMIPLIGNLSDEYGRKALLTLPMTLSIIPLAVLACSRTTNYYYAYYAVRTLTAMVSEGSINCLSLSYLADNISDSERASAFGILSGVSSGAFVCATLAARFLSTASTFQVATFVSTLALVYMRIFLEESRPDQVDSMVQPMLKEGEDIIQKDGNAPGKMPVFKKIPSLGDVICLLKSSPSFSQAAVAAFFASLAEGGMISSSMYYLKARFHFNKNQFADLMLIDGIASTISQLFLMPRLVSSIGDRRLLSVGLLVTCVNVRVVYSPCSTFIRVSLYISTFDAHTGVQVKDGLLMNFHLVCMQAILYSVAWSAWVTFFTRIDGFTTTLSIVMVFAPPSLRSIASKQFGPGEQGKGQGCISAVSSLANIIAPLIFSPLTALFLSEEAPFQFPGFSIMCIAITLVMDIHYSFLSSKK
ncbi:hippocampus abundant transcript-like protein 1 isoform X2 [Gossypium australe]|uniref:Hippocampus abundant transcript-like protein 1 isoform X2 n=1 Tax=Gossypium australe TaxID=47621 RepID=A0A5B6V184_9ROSI|nr:hippocampus abundant transcript-like protein 1 isoform X2 [Gossypium australe]